MQKILGTNFISLFLGLGLVHEGVKGVIEGIHEVGVVDGGLGACKNANYYQDHFNLD